MGTVGEARMAQASGPGDAPTRGSPAAPGDPAARTAAARVAAAATAPGTSPEPATGEPSRRPRIGLVLSGGGARGAAHLGVLRALERMRIPVDVITGTSMGAIVGAAYASGTSVAELETLLPQLDTATLLDDRPARVDLPLRRKADDYLPFIGPEFGFRRGRLQAPRGAVSGVALEAVLRRLLTVSGETDFSRLPIPFQAMATDVETGDAVLLRGGNLASAMRASMAVPGAIAPIEIDGRLLVDGGLVRNLPVEEARAMGAEVVIAVNVGTPLLRREQIDSLVAVSVQVVGLLTASNVRASIAQLGAHDILIEPALGDLSSANFNDMPKAVPLGEAATQASASRLSALALEPADYQRWQLARLRTREAPTRVVDDIRVPGLQRVNPAVVVGSMQTRVGQPIDPAVLDADLRRIYGRGDFEHVSYTLLEESGRQVLSVRAPEKGWGPDYLRLGLSLASELGGEAYFSLLASHRRTWMNALGAEWRNDLQVGRESRLVSEFYQPLAVNQSVFVAPRLEMFRRPIPVYEGQVRTGQYQQSVARVGVDLGAQVEQFGELRAGVRFGRNVIELDTGPVLFGRTRQTFDEAGFVGRAAIDRLDSARFPRSGYRAVAQLYGSSASLGASDLYQRYDADVLGARSWGAHTLQAAARVAGALGDRPLPSYDLVQWGGFHRQSGYAPNQLLGQSLAYGRLTYLNQWVRRGLFEGSYLGASLELGEVRDPLFAASPRGSLVSGSVFLAIDTPLGPFYVAYGAARDGNRAMYIYLGQQ
jgi:NTE family protein